VKSWDPALVPSVSGLFKYKAARIMCRIDSDTGVLVWDVPPSPFDPRGRELTLRVFARRVQDGEFAALQAQVDGLIAATLSSGLAALPFGVTGSIATQSLCVDRGVSPRAMFDNAKTMLFLLHVVSMVST
jgi:hypothetical protein